MSMVSSNQPGVMPIFVFLRLESNRVPTSPGKNIPHYISSQRRKTFGFYQGKPPQAEMI